MQRIGDMQMLFCKTGIGSSDAPFIDDERIIRTHISSTTNIK